MTQASLPPPGWYPDPYGGKNQRYWDGRAWLPPSPVRKAWTSDPLKVLLTVGVAVCVLLLGGVAIVAAVSPSTQRSPQSGKHQPSANNLDPTQYQPISQRDYALLLKDPEAAKGKRLILYGVVTQFDPATGTSDFRADTGAQHADRSNAYEVNTYIHAPDPAILKNVVEKDMITVHVEVAGTYSYETQSGRRMSVPLMNVYIIEVTRSGQ